MVGLVPSFTPTRTENLVDKATFNMTPRTSAALQRLMERTGDSKTDALNRSVQINDFLEFIWRNGGQVYVREGASGELQLLRVF
jgi:hypothetical protein